MVTARATAIACGLSIVFVGSVLAQGSIEPTGPLVGAVTADSARIWVHAAEGAKVEVRYGLADAEPAARVAFEPIEKPDAAIPGRAALATLTGLKVATAYRFAVSVDGKTSPELAGSFRTAPVGPVRFRVGVTSCMKIGQPQASWRLFLSQQPDLHLTLGDTHYADTTDPRVQWQHHLRYRHEPDFARVLRHSKKDGWRIYTFARHRLFDALREHKLSGVLYFSGDIHQSLVWEHPESERVGSAGGGDFLGYCRQQNAQLRDRGFRYGRGRPDGSGTHRVRRRPGAPGQVLAALNPQR